MGASGKRQGSPAAQAPPKTLARGFKPWAFTASSEARRRAAAPSEIWLEFPAVRTPSFLKAGLRAARDSRVVSGRIPSSRSTTTGPFLPWTSMGAISQAKRPFSVASAALLWER